METGKLGVKQSTSKRCCSVNKIPTEWRFELLPSRDKCEIGDGGREQLHYKVHKEQYDGEALAQLRVPPEEASTLHSLARPDVMRERTEYFPFEHTASNRWQRAG